MIPEPFNNNWITDNNYHFKAVYLTNCEEKLW